MVMIEIENIKKFMAGFLGGNLFDDFLMSEGKPVSYTHLDVYKRQAIVV